MSTLLKITFVLALPAVIPLRLKLRTKQMRTLARNFGLSYTNPQPLGIFHFYFKFLFHRKNLKQNEIIGVINGHTVHIYDNISPSIRFINYLHRQTVIKIDGEFFPGKTPYQTFKLGDIYFTPIATLRKVLKNLSLMT